MWTKVFSIGLIIYGVLVIIRKPPMEIGFEDEEPMGYLSNRGTIIVGILCIVAGCTWFILSLSGNSVFD
jgi:uncharacterized membrane protein